MENSKKEKKPFRILESAINLQVPVADNSLVAEVAQEDMVQQTQLPDYLVELAMVIDLRLMQSVAATVVVGCMVVFVMAIAAAVVVAVVAAVVVAAAAAAAVVVAVIAEVVDKVLAVEGHLLHHHFPQHNYDTDPQLQLVVHHL